MLTPLFSLEDALEEKPCPPSGRGFFCRCEVPRVERLALAKSDAVVIDEAHHCLDVGGVQDREDSSLRLAAAICTDQANCEEWDCGDRVAGEPRPKHSDVIPFAGSPK